MLLLPSPYPMPTVLPTTVGILIPLSTALLYFGKILLLNIHYLLLVVVTVILVRIQGYGKFP